MAHHKLQSNIWKTCYVARIGITGNFIFATTSVAQNTIIPDGTLGAEQSAVAPFDKNIDLITGGAIREQNLLHSFEALSIGNGNRGLAINLTKCHIGASNPCTEWI